MSYISAGAVVHHHYSMAMLQLIFDMSSDQNFEFKSHPVTSKKIAKSWAVEVTVLNLYICFKKAFMCCTCSVQISTFSHQDCPWMVEDLELHAPHVQCPLKKEQLLWNIPQWKGGQDKRTSIAIIQNERTDEPTMQVNHDYKYVSWFKVHFCRLFQIHKLK